MSKPTHRDAYTTNLALWIAYVIEGMSEDFTVDGVSEPADNYEHVYVTETDGTELVVTVTPRAKMNATQG
jgi:hypothetical protein